MEQHPSRRTGGAILIVEDDLHIGAMLEELLKKEGYEVLRAYSGTEAALVLSQAKPDLILLDLMLPGMSGEEVISRTKGIPVIVVSAKTDVDDKVDLLLGGAADYITKPFDAKELLARIAVQLRGRIVTEEAAELVFDDLVVDTRTHLAQICGQEVKLTRTEYAILKTLMLTPTQVITKSQLLDRICEDTPDCTESSLKTHISHLRAKLRGVSGKDYIESVWGIGFKMHTA